MGLWDLVELVLAVIGFFTIIVKAEEYVTLNGGGKAVKQGLWLLFSVGFLIMWVVGTVTACRTYGLLWGVLASVLIIAALMGVLRIAGSIPKAGTT